jgi:hypothetical protein
VKNLDEKTVKELEDIYAKAVAFVEKHFGETAKYPRDKRVTIITVMGYIIELEKLKAMKTHV